MPQILPLDLNAPPALPPIALTIGNFDGVHLGHQAMLQKTLEVAHRHQLNSAVMIFEPQPREFFDPANAPARLTNLPEKLSKINELSIDFVLIVPFNADFANLTAQAFCEFLQMLNVKAMILGDDFRFGKGRSGDKAFLGQFFEIYQVDSVLVDGERVSSTRIRHALQAGDLPLANRLLGTDYAITGQVVHGDKIGRTLDFPTANIALDRLRPAVSGVFGVAVAGDFDDMMGGIRLHDGTLFGCANVGIRPSVGGKEYRLEVHLPHFVGDLYDKVLTVKFLYFLHGEIKYDGLENLKNGIANDIQNLITWQQKFL